MSAYVHENTLFDAPFVCVCMQRVCVYIRAFLCVSVWRQDVLVLSHSYTAV